MDCGGGGGTRDSDGDGCGDRDGGPVAPPVRTAFRRRAAPRKPRARRRGVDEGSSSDDAEGRVGAGVGASHGTAVGVPQAATGAAKVAAEVRRKPRAQQRSASVAASVARAPRADEDGGEDSEGADPTEAERDYSAAGLARLEAETRSGMELRGPRARAGSEDSRDGAQSQMDPVLAARGRGVAVAAAAASAPSFIPLDAREAEIVQGGDVALEGFVGGLPGMAESDDDSGAGPAWEEEQLRRAGVGQPGRSGGAVAAAAARARAIVAEEAAARGGRGEVGLTLAETAAANLGARVVAARTAVEQFDAEVTAVAAAARRGEEEAVRATETARRAAARRGFYARLSAHLDDVHEMLAETAAGTAARVNAEAARLAALARARTSEVDEFGRVRRVSFDFDRDGYESPRREAVTEATEDPAATATEAGVIAAGDQCESSGEDSDGDARMPAPQRGGLGLRRDVASPGNAFRSGVSAGHGDEFDAVADEFKSIPALSARFVEWKVQFPDDYSVAYGDLSLGTTCGALALASGTATRTEWLDSIPRRAKAAAALKSRAPTWVALSIAATWEPQSLKSTEAHATSVERICHCLKDQAPDLRLAQSSFLRAAVDVLRWKADALRSTLDTAWAARAAVKCAQSCARVAEAVSATSADQSMLEDLVLQSLFCDIIAQFTSSVSPEAAKKFLVFAIRQGCISRDEREQSKFEFPDRRHPLWRSVRNALTSAIRDDPDPEAGDAKDVLDRVGGFHQLQENGKRS